MVEVNYCPQCGGSVEHGPEAYKPYIQCDECGRIYLEVWTYD